MAKIVYGPCITDMRGTLGGVIFARNHQGPVTRAWKKPANPKSPQQVMQRVWHKAVGHAWGSTLTATQRLGWIQKGSTTNRQNSIGQRYMQAGLQLYSQRNLLSLGAGGPTIYNVPVDVQCADPGNITVAADSGAQTVTLTPTNSLPGGYAVIVRATKQLSPGIYNLNKWFHSIINPGTVLFSDTFAGTAPVPPWTACPTYTAAHWPEASNTLTTAVETTIEAIRAGITLTDGTISCKITLPGAPTFFRPLTFRMNTSTGAHYDIRGSTAANWIGLYKETTWPGSTATYIAAWTWTGMDTHQHTWVLTLTGSTINLTIDGVNLGNKTDSTYASGDVGLCAANAVQSFNTYSVTTAGIVYPTIPDISALYLLKYGALVAGKKIGVHLRYVNLTTGQASTAHTASCTIT